MSFTRPVQRRRPRKRRDPLRSEIVIPRQGDRCSVGAADLPLEMSPGSIREHNQHLLEILKEVRRKVERAQSIELDRPFYKTMMRKLRGIGLSAYTSLGDDVVRELDALETKAGAPGLALTIKSDVFPLLWEMLYTGSSRGEVRPDQFWGFRHRLARHQLGARASDEEVIDPDCDFLFCYNQKLRYWQQEYDDVKRLASPHFRFYQLEDAPLKKSLDLVPSPDLSDHFIDVLALLELGLLHLACHCLPDSNQSGVLFSELVFSWQSTQICVKLHELKAARRDFGFSLQPLIFLNACKTMTNPEHLIHGDSFPGGFLRFGAAGVVATACDIPDQFAAAFAARFYENLLVNVNGRSPTVSEALLKTRQFFIAPPYYNLLGLAYGLYARNDLHIDWEPWGNREEMIDEAS